MFEILRTGESFDLRIESCPERRLVSTGPCVDSRIRPGSDALSSSSRSQRAIREKGELMNARKHGILALAVGATLALGASTANARMVVGDGASVRADSSASSTASAAALKALDLRWEAIAKSYRLKHSAGDGTRPDDRSGIRGV
jgi:hypothetical protein